ncbi:MAG: Acetyltransferase (GNAT) family protein [Candidatus Fermentimicrarchaeum limneticum]|uniref:Acetyltransferase (GNAT) family protein n=1 Tax=Fermentimicrarchaeum limneticum TaxID=2795018 RepID=A0A7D5XCD7_FERL1|nr:MAG: Acetyltransferase (GNAT) family protein [Candidatus Fermentimicrarchaeum limneticum]
MDLTIRNAKLQDIGFVLSGIREIFKIENDIFVYNEKKKLVSNAIRDKHIRVVMKGGRSVGFLWFRISDLTPFGLDYGKWSRKYCWISFVYAVKSYRNQGIGSLLYDDIMRICKKRRVKQIMLDVFTVNKKSASFHKKRGFKPLLSIYRKTL